MKQKGFLRYNPDRDRYYLDWKKTLSIVVGELLLEEVLAAREYMKGYLLDVGCGARPYALIYDDRVEMSVATEVPDSPYGTLEADVICCAEHLPFASRQFDFILCTEVLEHTQQPFQVLCEFARILKPGAYLFLSVPFIYPIHDAPVDYWRFTLHGLDLACQYAGLQPLYIRPKGGLLVTLMSLWINFTIRVINGTGKLLNLSRPLYERAWIRWLLALPQWIYIRLGRRLWRNRWTDKCVRRLSGLLKRSAWLDELNLWAAAGYVLLAQAPVSQYPKSGTGDESSFMQG